MQFVSIASGSSGNCIFVGSDTTSILVDAGISNKRIEQGLNEIGRKGSELDGIMITHEHSDHVKGLGVLARKQGVPIYGTKETLDEITKIKSLGEFPQELLHPIQPCSMRYKGCELAGEAFRFLLPCNISFRKASCNSRCRLPVRSFLRLYTKAC